MRRKALRCESQSPQTSCPTLSYRPRKWPRMLCTPAKDKANVVHRKLMKKQCKKYLKGSIFIPILQQFWLESLYIIHHRRADMRLIYCLNGHKSRAAPEACGTSVSSIQRTESYIRSFQLSAHSRMENYHSLFLNCLWKTPWSYFKTYSIDYYKM